MAGQLFRGDHRAAAQVFGQRHAAAAGERGEFGGVGRPGESALVKIAAVDASG